MTDREAAEQRRRVQAQIEATGEVSATAEKTLDELKKSASATVPILGITGTGGAGKSSLTDELVRRFLNEFSDKAMAILSIDPTKQKTGGALLGPATPPSTA